MAAIAVTSLLACDGPRTHTLGPYTVAITETTAPALVAGTDGVWQVTRPIGLPLRPAPSDLPTEGTAPYPRKPWFSPRELRVQASYVISNLEDREIAVELLVDGWNEFAYYAPTVTLVPGQVMLDRSTIDRLVSIPPHGRVTGRVSWDEFERMALVLSMLMNGAPNAQHLVQPQVDPATSPLGRLYVPASIDGLTGFDLSLRTRSAAKVAAELVVEVLDEGDHVAQEPGSVARERPPQPLVPRPRVP